MEERTTEEDGIKMVSDSEIIENMNNISSTAYNVIVKGIGDLRLTDKEKDILLINSVIDIFIFSVKEKIKEDHYEDVIETLRQLLTK